MSQHSIVEHRAAVKEGDGGSRSRASPETTAVSLLLGVRIGQRDPPVKAAAARGHAASRNGRGLVLRYDQRVMHRAEVLLKSR
ncbi:hypothetical protein EAO75_30595 [Streptomyces sp. uw30]|uniref:hypothetical protein n=1 Tax=Streptomyces sp. uw30 TaxID=1828179 RepID=UPI0011CEBA53|nr:hypothetical protein [Streptomyces sp. uw30]TXS43098.1 hypothetical protein EAO75_30595 [Streptomyces sp. uw30]